MIPAKRCKCDAACECSYHYEFEHRGRRYRGSTHTANYKLAIRVAERERNAVVAKVAGVATAEPITARLSAVAAQHATWVPGFYRHPTTRSAALLVVQRFQAMFAPNDPCLLDITAFDLERHRSARLNDAERSTVQSQFFLLQSFFRQAAEWHPGYAPPQVKPWTLDEGEVEILTDAELQTALTGLPPTYALICRVTLETLARLQEVLGLTIHDIGADWMKRRLKGGKQKRVRIAPDLAAALRAHRRPGAEYLFEEPVPLGRTTRKVPGAFRRLEGKYVSAQLRALFDKLGLARVHHHLFRHTGITLMCDRGESPRTIQELAGWSSLDMLQRYGHVRDASLTQAVRGNAAAVAAILAGGHVVPPKSPTRIIRRNGKPIGSTEVSGF